MGEAGGWIVGHPGSGIVQISASLELLGGGPEGPGRGRTGSRRFAGSGAPGPRDPGAEAPPAISSASWPCGDSCQGPPCRSGLGFLPMLVANHMKERVSAGNLAGGGFLLKSNAEDPIAAGHVSPGDGRQLASAERKHGLTWFAFLARA